MRGWAIGAAALAVSGAATGAADRDGAELVVEGDGVRPASLMGVPVRLRIDPAAPGMPIVDPDAASRARLRSGPLSPSYGVGPVRIAGRSAVARVDLGRGPVKRRVTWADRAFADDADVTVGPSGLPDPLVRFRLRPARQGERTVALPLAGGGGLVGGWGVTAALLTVDGRPLRVRFDPRRPTVATAGAGVAIARAQAGALEGEAATTEIAFSVERPVRRMRLARPLVIGPLAVDRMLVRVSDFGSAASIAETGAPPPDPDEVVVTAKGKRDRSRDALTVGRDQLARCSSILFDKRARQVRLSCL
jgi:hypothetical protein